jgi:hypothetical protein
MYSNKICNTLKISTTYKNALLEVTVSQNSSVFTSTSTEFKTEAQGIKKLHFTEHKGFIPVFIIDPYPQPKEFSPKPTILLFKELLSSIYA